VTYAV
jgi:hypothetical protein